MSTRDSPLLLHVISDTHVIDRVTVLHIAAEYDNLVIVRAVLVPVHLYERDIYNSYALHHAAAGGGVATLEYYAD